MEIRSACEEDLDEVVDLWRREGGPTSQPCGYDEAAALVRRDPDALLVARDDGALIGTLIVGWDGWRCHLYRLAVEPSWRRRRVASLLVEAATRRARVLGIRKLDAVVALDNAAAISFWEHEAFEHEPANGRWSRQL